MTTLFEAALALAKCLTPVREGTATEDGSTTSLLDAYLAAANASLQGGTVWITGGTYIGNSRPIRQHLERTLAWTEAFATLIEAGDAYAAAGPRFPRYLLWQAINQALDDLGDFGQWDATLETVAEQEEYDLPDDPTVVSNVATVEIATELTEPYHYEESHHWHETVGATIRFSDGWEPEDSGYLIRLGYNAKHPVLTTDAGVLYPGINLGRLKWEAALHAYRFNLENTRATKADDPTRELMNEAAANALRARPHNLMRIKPAVRLTG